MIETIALWIGYIIIIAFGLALIGILMWITYITYDYYLKKLLGWKNQQVRKDIFYFMKHKAEIQEYIKNKSSSNSSSDKSESFNKNFTTPKAKPSPSKDCFHPCCPFRNEDDKCEIDVLADEDNSPYRESNPSQNCNIMFNLRGRPQSCEKQ